MKQYYVQFLFKSIYDKQDIYKGTVIEVGSGECPLGKANEWLVKDGDYRSDFIRITMFNYLGEFKNVRT